MRCVAYCIAQSLKIDTVADFFRKKNYYVKSYREVLYLKSTKNSGEIFIFKFGCFVSWGLVTREEKALAAELKNFAIDLLNLFEIDRFSFVYREKTSLYSHDRFNADIITLEDNDVQIKLAISYGLAQSVKLESYEESVQRAIRINSSLPIDLARTGKISLTGRAISQRIGEIFIERNSINLTSEYLDMPEYFWQYPSLESYYVITEKFLDLTRRVNSLNQRLDVLQGLLDMLNSQLQHRHSSFLETIIILLIMVEIILTLLLYH